jgi:hypothetical protein
MSYSLKQAVMEVGVLSVPGASGYSDLDVLLSDDLFDKPSIMVVPHEDTSGKSYRYAVTVYIDGEVVEHHSYTAAGVREIPHMAYPGKLFPPNMGVSVKAGMKGWDPNFSVFTVRITNFEDTNRTFKVCSTHYLCSGGAYKRLTP